MHCLEMDMLMTNSDDALDVIIDKVKRLQGEIPHSDDCRQEDLGVLDIDGCSACLVLADFGITDQDILAVKREHMANKAAS